MKLLFPSIATISFLFQCCSLGRVAAFRPSTFYCPYSSRRLVLAAATMPPSDATPPVARREEDRVVLAGVGPPPRQSESSTEKLLDPPVPVPDPYGWMRDEKRENKEGKSKHGDTV